MERSLAIVGIVLVLAGMLVWWGGYFEPSAQPVLVKYTEHPYFVAHSWYGNEFPMSSLAQTQAAVAEGLQFIDLDVRLSADGVPVVFHDPHLKQTERKQGAVSDLLFSTLSGITITPQGNYSGPDQTIASLASHLEIISAATGTPVAVIEIKDWAPQVADEAEEAVLKQLEHYDLQERSIVVTAHPLRVCSIKNKAPQQLVMYTFVDNNYVNKRTHFFTLPWYVRYEPARRFLRKWCPPDVLAIEKTVATSTIMTLVSAGYPVFLWSLQSPHDYERARELGVFAVVGEGFSTEQP